MCFIHLDLGVICFFLKFIYCRSHNPKTKYHTINTKFIQSICIYIQNIILEILYCLFFLMILLKS